MSRFNNNDKSVWGPHRPDTFPNGSSHHPNPSFNNRRVSGGFNQQPLDDRELETRPTDDLQADETDRHFDSLAPNLSWETEPPLGFDEDSDGEFDDGRRRRTVDRGFRTGIPIAGTRDAPYDERGCRDGRFRNEQGWEQTGFRQPRQQFAGQALQFDRPALCWDPPQQYQSNVQGDRQQEVTMKPPRFDEKDTTNWVSRVQFYFDHLMMPDARLHYAAMLFDPPVSEWVFNYCVNSEFVTWQDFLEDVRHRFDRQSFKDYFGLLAKLTQTGTVLAYHDTFERYLNRV